MGWLSLPEGGDFQMWSRDFTETAYVAEKKIDGAVNSVTRSLDKEIADQFASQADSVQQHYAVRFRQDVNDKGLEVEADLGPLLWSYLGEFDQKATELVPKEQQTAPIKQLRELDDEILLLFRRNDLQRPSSLEEFEQNLWWMTEQGQEKDLSILRSLAQKPPYDTEEIRDLLKIAEQKIRERVDKPSDELQPSKQAEQEEKTSLSDSEITCADRIAAILLRDETLDLLEAIDRKDRSYIFTSNRLLHTFADLVSEGLVAVEDDQVVVTKLAEQYLEEIANWDEEPS